MDNLGAGLYSGCILTSYGSDVYVHLSYFNFCWYSNNLLFTDKEGAKNVKNKNVIGLIGLFVVFGLFGGGFKKADQS